MIFLDNETMEKCVYPVFIQNKRYLLDKDPYAYFLEKVEETKGLQDTVSDIVAKLKEDSYFHSGSAMNHSDAEIRALHKLYQKFINDPEFLYHFTTDGGHFMIDVEMYRMEEPENNNIHKNTGEDYDS